MPASKRSQTRRRSGAAGNADAAQAMRDSVQKVWLAGLGALERARTEGPRMFDLLVAQGRVAGARAMEAADQALKSVREGEAAVRWEKLGEALEGRVSSSLRHLGMPTSEDVESLSRQLDQLSERLEAYAAGPSRRAAAKGKKRPAARKAKAVRRPRRKAARG